MDSVRGENLAVLRVCRSAAGPRVIVVVADVPLRSISKPELCSGFAGG